MMDAEEVARRNTILHASVEGGVLGICLEPPGCGFTQWVCGPVCVLGLREWVREVLAGDVEVLQVLFAPPGFIDALNFGGLLRERYAHLFITQRNAGLYSEFLEARGMQGLEAGLAEDFDYVAIEEYVSRCYSEWWDWWGIA